MKKQYTTPNMKAINICPSEILCVSFGTDTTDTMHSNKREDFSEDNTDFIFGSMNE